MVAGCQKEYDEKFSQLEHYENTVKEKEKKADDMIASQSKWIEKQAAAMSERRIIQAYIGYVEQAGNWLAGFSNGISQPIAATNIYWLLYIVVEVLMIAALLALFFFAGRKFLIWYKEQMADNISLWVAFVALAVSIFLGSEIRSFLPMNLILLNVVVHLIYCGVKAYIRGCRKNRE